MDPLSQGIARESLVISEVGGQDAEGAHSGCQRLDRSKVSLVESENAVGAVLVRERDADRICQIESKSFVLGALGPTLSKAANKAEVSATTIIET